MSYISTNDISLIVPCNNIDLLNTCVMASGSICDSITNIYPISGAASCGAAFSKGFAKTTTDYIIFAHQDVYFPSHWLKQLVTQINYLELNNIPWGIIGVWGRSIDSYIGRVYCVGGKQEHVGLLSDIPTQAIAIDEIVIVYNRKSDIIFDENLGFHLYALDMTLQCMDKGLDTYVINAPVIHNSTRKPVLDPKYYESYYYMRKKWKDQLPLRTCVLDITRFAIPVFRRRCHDFLKRLQGNDRQEPPVDDPKRLARELGYE